MEIEKLDDCIELSEGSIDTDVKMSCIEEISGDITQSGALEVGRFKVFNDKIYDQTKIDNFSCTLVGSFTALSNSKNVDVPLELMKEAFQSFENSGKFTQGKGAYISDGAKFAMDAFNFHFKTQVKMETVPFTPENMIRALKCGFMAPFGIKYGKGFLKNEQDNGKVEDEADTVGNLGHCVSLAVCNTTDPKIGTQLKYVENYQGKLVYNVIYVNYSQLPKLFQNTMVRFFE